jgi:hypothetical protein
MLQSGFLSKVLSGNRAKIPKPKTDASTTVVSGNSVQLIANFVPPAGMWRAPPKRKKPRSDKVTFKDLRNSDFEIVVHNSILDHDAVGCMPVPLPAPTLLGTGCVCFDVGGSRFR